LLNFVGTGSGFVTTWYDQSGNNKHVSQFSNGSQPLIVNNGSLYTVNGKPRVQFASGLELLYNAPIASLTEVSTYTAYYINTNLGQLNVWTTNNNNTWWNGYIGIFSSPRRDGYPGSPITLGSVLFSSYHTGSAMTSFMNGSSKGTNTASSFSSGSFLSLGPVRGINQFAGGIYELILYPTSDTGSRLGIESNINSYYQLY
jgi:hypothetical protein